MPPTTCKALLKDYSLNCSFAGVRFIADESKHWIERLVWLALVVLSWYGSALLITSAFDNFVLSPISFGVETTYTDWETKMPATAVCETENKKMVYNIADTIWTPKHDFNLDDALKDIAYFSGTCYNLLRSCHNAKKFIPQCPLNNYSYLGRLVRSPCPGVVTDCSYNYKKFDCCKYFQPIETEFGPCFILNSVQTEKPNPYPMLVNMQDKRSILRFTVLVRSKLYTLGNDEVPTVSTLQMMILQLLGGHKYQRWISVKNIVNDELVQQTELSQRACRFQDENEVLLYPKYSYSGCTVLCRKKAQVDTCGCNSHYMLGTTEDEHCNISGLACLHKNSQTLTTLRPSWVKRTGLVCDCMPSCTGVDLNIIHDRDVTDLEHFKGKSSVEIYLNNLPTERFKRNVVRSRLDLVVSIGGATGLFLGASILSFVELFFYFTIRFVNNVLIEKRARKEQSKKLAQNKLQIFDTKEYDEPRVYTEYTGDSMLDYNLMPNIRRQKVMRTMK